MTARDRLHPMRQTACAPQILHPVGQSGSGNRSAGGQERGKAGAAARRRTDGCPQKELHQLPWETFSMSVSSTATRTGAYAVHRTLKGVFREWAEFGSGEIWCRGMTARQARRVVHDAGSRNHRTTTGAQAQCAIASRASRLRVVRPPGPCGTLPHGRHRQCVFNLHLTRRAVRARDRMIQRTLTAYGVRLRQ